MIYFRFKGNVALTSEKKEKILDPCKSCLTRDSFTIREWSTVTPLFFIRKTVIRK